MDDIGDIADLVAARVSWSHRGRLNSHFAGDSCDRIDIQPVGWPAFGLRRLAPLVINTLSRPWQSLQGRQRALQRC